MCSVHKLVANVMTALDSRKSKLRMHYEQHLNSFYEIDNLLKKLANNKLESNIIASARNNLNISPVLENVDKAGPTRHMWEENNYGEKGVQPNKEKFTSQNGNFGEILLNKLHAKKVLDHLSPDEPIESETRS